MIDSAKKKENAPLGSVLVVGAGVAGIQTAVDLSAAGYKAYLLEKASAIGGHMAMLDKTFPTNDCAMCTLSPRLVSVGQDRNIEILTLADLLRLEGRAGRFTATVRLRPRFVDADKCTGCGQCSEVCPAELDNDFNQGLNTRKAIDRLYPQAVPNTFAIRRAERPRCMLSCPLGTNPQGYIALVRQRRYHEALQTLRDTNPLPSVCGRVCHHPCELNCARAAYDDPVSVMSLKRFLVDYCAAHPADAELQDRLEAGDKCLGRVIAPPTGKRVAVIGSGPAGLTAADYLARRGHQVTVFEALDEPGGMLRVGIPQFRLPHDILERDIQAIRELGVQINCNQKLGRDITLADLKVRGYEAILLAIGAHAPRSLGVPGEEAPALVEGMAFLRSVNLGQAEKVGPRVVVIGGGNVAVDVARTARRLGGSQVTILYRRSEVEMPALAEEVEQAQLEGVLLHTLAAPLQVAGNDQGELLGLKCIRMRLGEADESGRCRPVPIPDSEFFVEADTVITAVGQGVETEPLREIVELTSGRLKAAPQSLATSADGIFAAGDAVTGPQTVTGAMGQGRRAAVSIDNYLAGRPLETGQCNPAPAELPPLEQEHLRQPRVRTPRQPGPVVPTEERLRGFDEVNLAMDEEAAVAEAERCLDCGLCSDCLQCVRVCEAGAIRLDDQPTERRIDIGGVVVASGHSMFDARLSGEYGYGRYANVMTALEFERLLSASGPTSGRLLRRGDGTEIKRLAFIQCVGSRQVTDRGCEYCSSVCCMYATKEAMLAAEHAEGLKATIFMIDMRAHGKGYEAYYQRAEQSGVRYVRSMVSAVRQDFATGDLHLEFSGEEDRNLVETFDAVVLSTALQCHPQAAEMARLLGLQLDEHGFVRTGSFSPGTTSRQGVVVCGTAAGPKDIPDSVTEASAAAAMLGKDLSATRFSCQTAPEYPVERDVSSEPPRVGVFVCHCGNNIAGVVDVQSLVEFAGTLPGVAYAERSLYTCSPEGLAMIIKAVGDRKLNRVVVASCTPRTHLAIFQDALRQAGLNKYLIEMANIRDQCTWVHGDQPEQALGKARDLLASATAKACRLTPLEEQIQPVVQTALVIGGGLAGMVAAGNLAEQGFEVHLVERTAQLGGQLRHIRRTLEGDDVAELMNGLIEGTQSQPSLTVHLESTLQKCTGSVGNFESVVAANGSRQTLRHGVTIVATGAEMYEPTEYEHGRCDKVVTQRELERRLALGSVNQARQVVMIQCVGCRTDERPYCSRICCGEAVKNSLEIKERNPDCRVTVLYKDVRTFGRAEQYYLRAREAGVVFIRYDDDHKPEVHPDGSVRVTDPSTGRQCNFEPDLVVLSAAVVGSEENKVLAQTLRVPMTQDGFFLEAHVKLRPVDFACEGVFLAGLAHGPKFIPETIAQALAAAGRAATILCKETIRASGSVSVVDSELCAACLTCVRVCPHSVPRIEDGVAVIEPAACQGCGVCAAECPAGAIALQSFTDPQLRAAVGGLFQPCRPDVEEAARK
ncbi:MAG: FAD-dependent oxidoreductase [Anaerolineaceae bacterium]|nr:FAD-dependent oxidoreductase [Anaerolineaceae bacterium]